MRVQQIEAGGDCYQARLQCEAVDLASRIVGVLRLRTPPGRLRALEPEGYGARDLRTVVRNAYGPSAIALTDKGAYSVGATS
jgi:hypothetical protein